MNKAKWFKGLFVVVLMIYPFLVFLGIQAISPGAIGLVLLLVLAMRFGVLHPEERRLHLPILFVLIAYALLAIILRSEKFLLYYPVVVNLVLFAVFVISLRGEESILLRLVKARGVKISAYGPAYLNRLTCVWAGFFLLNALVSVWSTTQTIATWTLYNGLIAYLLVAALVGVEWSFRIHYKKRKGV